ncbi:MAG TPA: DUF5694 domain-containing protein, partial [Thermoanaerobaculia bacterium]|nr:DUF5694 domain-containing protein [Thermoanaerobaculia bacterium]
MLAAGSGGEILLLGTFHFANPGLDYVKGDVPDVLTEERQREIAGLVERLKKFNPNKIAVEWPSDRQADLNQRYAGYRAGEHRAERNETYQIGFRLADLQALPA